MCLFKRKKKAQHNKTHSGGIYFWRLHSTMAYHFPLMQILGTWAESAAFLKNTLWRGKLLFKGSSSYNSGVKSEPWWQEWQEFHFYRGSDLDLLFLPFTAISMSHSAGFYRRIQGIFCSASCGISFGNEKTPAYTGWVVGFDLMVSRSQGSDEQRIVTDIFQLQRVAVTSVWHPQQ